MAKALLKAMEAQGSIETPGLRVAVESDGELLQYLYLKGGTTREKATFSKALAELLDVVENQRYLLVKGSKHNYMSYYCVPEVLSRKKEDAQLLAHYVSKSIGKYEALYTRNPEGRKVLLKARAKAYVNRGDRFINKKKKVRKTH